MVFVSVVVLEVIEPMVVLDPRLHHNTLVVLRGGLQEFLDPRSDLIGQKVLQVPLVVQG